MLVSLKNQKQEMAYVLIGAFEFFENKVLLVICGQVFEDFKDLDKEVLCLLSEMAGIRLVDLVQHVKNAIQTSNLFKNLDESQCTTFCDVVYCYFQLLLEENF